MISPKLANAIAAVVTAVWVASLSVSLFSTSYHFDPSVNLPFMMLIGYLWGAGRKKEGDAE